MARDDRDEPVVLSRIYTRTGDGGTTALGDMSRVSKTDPRLAAYADVDEANSAIGVALALGQLPEDVWTPVVQEDLGYEPLRVLPEYTTRLEEACDHYNAQLEKLSSFILPGGTP